MLKTPVSILQELTVQKKLAPPTYDINGIGEAHSMTFTCQAKTGNHSAVGKGKTKKDAKHDAAKNMLSMFGIKIDDGTQVNHNICLLPTKGKSIQSEGPAINYIGKLNEFCSGHKYPQPTYIETPIVQNAQFCIICNFLTFKTEGYGSNKKDAKQDTAKKMLELLKESDFHFVPAEDSLKDLEEDNEVTELVKQKYTELMENLSINDKKNANNNVVTIDQEEVNISTWDELTNLFDRLGYKYDLSTFQRTPLILCLKVNEHVLMHYGNSREQIMNKLVDSVIDMIKHQIDFSKPLLES